MNNWTRSANILVMDFYMPPHMVRTGGSVRTKLTLVRFFLCMSSLVAFQVARADGFIMTTRKFATVVVNFL